MINNDLTGKKFGKLTVLKISDKKGNRGQRHWDCKCDCGNIVSIYSCHLRSGHSTTCGCYRNKHNLSKSRFYRIYQNMKDRCNNYKNKRYKDYGGRGITNKWLNFIDFKNDMYKDYLKHCKEFGENNTSLDRIDNNDNYYKENCKWSTKKEQSNNTRTNYIITYNNKSLTLAQWSKKLNIKYDTLRTRFRRGWTIKRAFSTK